MSSSSGGGTRSDTGSLTCPPRWGADDRVLWAPPPLPSAASHRITQSTPSTSLSAARKRSALAGSTARRGDGGRCEQDLGGPSMPLHSGQHLVPDAPDVSHVDRAGIWFRLRDCRGRWRGGGRHPCRR